MSEPASRQPPAPSTVQQICSGLILALFLVRYFNVAESAAQGDTLWIVALWFAVSLIWLGCSFRAKTLVVSFNWLDFSVVLLTGGHILSALVVVATTGEKRSAINLAWEWTGVLIGWFLLRQECRLRTFRRELLCALVAVGTAVSGLGLYQHYIDFPRMAATYGPVFEELKHADPTRAASIRQKLANDNIPVDGPGITLFQKRLTDSREPFGLFALANTFGGFLAVCLVLAFCLVAANWRTSEQIDGVGGDHPPIRAERQKTRERHADSEPVGAVHERTPHPNPLPAGPGRGDKKRTQIGLLHVSLQLLPFVLMFSLLGCCLLLTKSRTACIGTVAGLGMWFVGTGRFKLSARQLSLIGLSVIVVMLAGWGLSRLGGLDRQVITEAPKSLQYRLQYWSATWQMIKAHPWLGVGPGQFRSNYLFYKLPEASEEIADPHNLFFDVAANAGIVAFLGLSMLSVGVFIGLGRRVDLDERDIRWTESQFVSWILTGLAAAAWCFLIFGYDDRLLIVLPVTVVLFWWLRRILYSRADLADLVCWSSRSAAVVLLIHLLGAGGIGMPAISLLFLALIAVADGERLAISAGSVSRSLSLTGSFFVLNIAALIAIFATALIPVSVSQAHLAKGDQFVQDAGKQSQAATEYRLAATADDFSADPWRKQAGLVFYQVQADRFQSNDLFLNAVRLMREARARDPANFHDDEAVGDWWLSRWRVTNDAKDAGEAVLAIESAWRRYPTNALLMAELSFAHEAASDAKTAREMAIKALKQDELNHQCQHVDRYLDDSIRMKLEKLAN